MLTLTRTYSLPNCTLTLEGIAASGNTNLDRPPLSILTHFECLFLGLESPLSGNRELLEALNQAVSLYAQSLLSGVGRPWPSEVADRVALERRSLDHHALTIHQSENSAGQPQGRRELTLTTVQLFDLVDALDQVCADSQTLPELRQQFSPASRRYSPYRQAPTERAAPLLFGVASLTVAAVALFFLPVPKIEPPQEPAPAQTSAVNPSATPTPTAPPTPEITDPQLLSQLREQTYTQIDRAWRKKASVESDLTYRLSVNANGLIVGYRPLDGASADYDSDTPLRSLSSVPTPSPSAAGEPTAQFKVTFKADGQLSIEPYNEGETITPTASP